MFATPSQYITPQRSAVWAARRWQKVESVYAKQDANSATQTAPGQNRYELSRVVSITRWFDGSRKRRTRAGRMRCMAKIRLIG